MKPSTIWVGRAVIVWVSSSLLLTGCLIPIDEGQIYSTSRTVSPDRNLDFVNTSRGGGGAAGWTSTDLAIVVHGGQPRVEDSFARFTGGVAIAARWLGANRLDLAVFEHLTNIPSSVTVGGQEVEITVENLRGCSPSHLSLRDTFSDGTNRLKVRVSRCDNGLSWMELEALTRTSHGQVWQADASGLIESDSTNIPAFRDGTWHIQSPRIFVGDSHEISSRKTLSFPGKPTGTVKRHTSHPQKLIDWPDVGL